MMPPAAIALGEVGEVDPPRQASKIVVNIGCRRNETRDPRTYGNDRDFPERVAWRLLVVVCELDWERTEGIYMIFDEGEFICIGHRYAIELVKKEGGKRKPRNALDPKLKRKRGLCTGVRGSAIDPIRHPHFITCITNSK